MCIYQLTSFFVAPGTNTYGILYNFDLCNFFIPNKSQRPYPGTLIRFVFIYRRKYDVALKKLPNVTPSFRGICNLVISYEWGKLKNL